MSKKFKDYWKTVTAKEADEYMDTLGIKMRQKTVDIGYAGPEPKSLLAEQDLETTSKSEGTFSVWYYDKSGAKKCAVFPNPIEAQGFVADLMSMGYKKGDIKVVAKGQVEKEISPEKNKTQNMTEGTSYKGFYIVGWKDNDTKKETWEVKELTGTFGSKNEAKAAIDRFVETHKGQVEQTGKKLDELADKAEDADTKEEVKSLVNRIKATQIRRQKATIKERSEESDTKNKSFKEVWNGKK